MLAVSVGHRAHHKHGLGLGLLPIEETQGLFTSLNALHFFLAELRYHLFKTVCRQDNISVNLLTIASRLRVEQGWYGLRPTKEDGP